ncbi:uncharacterized protein LOC124448723 isoform X1 [Xenia sp. Carnegie-2017]|uniref:uncharacterized protein LOC124448723 isoform X1 n=1 Tax=Xenia sp. Carnegie-2017 TaxID=2897299 RepID=UPI001F049D6D|nr:uncharacterized protein LOC124448723 isoform X1 [Xenia sp. Carnegie-2017]
MATSATQDDCHKNEKVRSKMNIYHEAIHSRQLDGLILTNFFAFFVVSFVAGLLFLYSTVSLWPFQVCEDVDLYEPITFAAQQPQNIVNIVTYNASAPFSLHA